MECLHLFVVIRRYELRDRSWLCYTCHSCGQNIMEEKEGDTDETSTRARSAFARVRPESAT